MLDELAASLKEKGFIFTYDDAVAAYLANKSYSLTYGARNLRRTIQKELEDVIAGLRSLFQRHRQHQER